MKRCRRSQLQIRRVHSLDRQRFAVNRDRGCTLVELTVSIGIGAVVLAIGISLLIVQARIAQNVQERSELLGDVTWAIQVIADDVREAGLDPTAARLESFSFASAHDFSRNADLDEDGRIDPHSNEVVVLAPGAKQTLMRWVGRQATPLLGDLSGDGFRIEYFDHRGLRLGEPSGVLSPEERERVARLSFEIFVGRNGAPADRRLELRSAASVRSRLDRKSSSDD